MDNTVNTEKEIHEQDYFIMSYQLTRTAFQACRYVADIDPYTSQPTIEVEILQQTPVPFTQDQLVALQAKYKDRVWVQETQVWS